ncbi:contact-dependent growth inhibition system immunity protein [Paenibacillus aurantiacus]|uniref:Contact-dependent growth inhibition system immunity protein n=1 Tax=Paenibacillus aurantiacus TaxID=1936118 RepID=A0ABV5KKN6_9BACL
MNSLISFDLNKNLQELDGNDWGEPNYNSGLVVTCHALRTKPLKDFTAADLRIMIGQQINSEYLIPMALELLAKDPFVKGDCYKGDLLASVLQTASDFWDLHPDLNYELDNIMIEVDCFIEVLSPLAENYNKVRGNWA